MNIAYFSPLLPKQTGISQYSENLLKYMMKKSNLDLWVEGYRPSSFFLRSRFKIIDYVKSPQLISHLSKYDSILYNIGNNPYYHSEIYDVFLKNNGVVILHDFVLYYLITGYYLDKYKSRNSFLEEMKYNLGDNGIKEGLQILNSNTPPLQFNQPERFPLNSRLIKTAKGIIVHSDYTKDLVKKIYPNANCIKINQIAPEINLLNQLSKNQVQWIRNRYGIKESEVMLASFGFVAPTKRIHKVLESLSKLKNKNFKYVIVGSGNYVSELVKKYNLTDKVIFTGFLSSSEFDNLMHSSDIVINLRYPYMGETSASAIRGLAFGKAMVVSDTGWFSELPDNAVVKVPVDGREVDVLTEKLEKLINDKTLRQRLSEKANLYSNKELNGEKISQQIVDFLNKTK
jgi:glycosyltransferase involved in cell wall biosynthesis